MCREKTDKSKMPSKLEIVQTDQPGDNIFQLVKITREEANDLQDKSVAFTPVGRLGALEILNQNIAKEEYRIRSADCRILIASSGYEHGSNNFLFMPFVSELHLITDSDQFKDFNLFRNVSAQEMQFDRSSTS